MTIKDFSQVIVQAGKNWSDDKAPTMGAALAYYTIFSLAPLLMITLSVASMILGEDVARHGLGHEIRNTLGPVAADAIAAVLDSAYRSGGNTATTIIGLVLLAVGASGVFVQLQDSLNVIWKAGSPSAGSAWVRFLRDRLLSFAAVAGTGLLLLATLVVSSALAMVNRWLRETGLPGEMLLWQTVSALVSLGVLTLLFAMIFKLLPDVPIAWGDVWAGGVLTACLFTLGQQFIGWYLGRSGVTSAFGAAGSLVVLLVWVYYSAQIVLFGAEFTHAYATPRGAQQAGGTANSEIARRASEPSNQIA